MQIITICLVAGLLVAIIALSFYLNKALKELKKQKELIERLNMQNDTLTQDKMKADAENKAKTSFIYNVSRDMRTPMNIITGLYEMIQNHQGDPVKLDSYIIKLGTPINDLLSIINNLLDITGIEQGNTEVNHSAWNIREFYDNIHTVFANMMEEKGIYFSTNVEVNNPYVYLDAIKYREIIINIVSNAYKYTDRYGSVNIHLEEIPSELEGYVYYQTIISDTGAGISKRFLPYIFDEFSREKKHEKNDVQGSKLGLPIVKRLIECMNGKIEVQTERGEGTSFIITIPLKIADKSNLVNYVEEKIDPSIFMGKRILLVEDNPLNAEIAMEILEEAGFKLEHAEDGLAALTMLIEKPEDYYDLILMDILMPNMNGYDATLAIRDMESDKLSAIPIVAMTANAFEEDIKEAINVGMNGYLAKPINIRELMRELARILDKQ